MQPIWVARVIPEQTVEKGDKITFTYQNATAPAMPEKSSFKFFFDGTQVMPDLDVIVQSAKGVSKLALSAANFNIDTDGSTDVTVSLQADDGSNAVRSEDTVVSLTASSGTIASSVTIAAGEYMATTKLSATVAANITLNASTTVTGIAAAEAVTVHADTDNVLSPPSRSVICTPKRVIP